MRHSSQTGSSLLPSGDSSAPSPLLSSGDASAASSLESSLLAALVCSVSAAGSLAASSEPPPQIPARQEGLLTEQVKRARESGKSPRQAFFLCGPDSGIPGIAKHHPGLEDLPPEEWFNGDTLEEKLGGGIHIPYEGVCGADLYVYPAWRKIHPEAWAKEGAQLDWATARKPCNHLLIEHDLGEPACATRIGPIAGNWWLYSSKAPYKRCSPFHEDD